MITHETSSSLRKQSALFVEAGARAQLPRLILINRLHRVDTERCCVDEKLQDASFKLISNVANVSRVSIFKGRCRRCTHLGEVRCRPVAGCMQRRSRRAPKLRAPMQASPSWLGRYRHCTLARTTLIWACEALRPATSHSDPPAFTNISPASARAFHSLLSATRWLHTAQWLKAT